jgi:cytochrome c biogenesis protein CcmG/thiol:disulfide interchange protein DsbE
VSEEPGNRKRTLVMAALLVPIVGLMVLMAWALAQTGGNPGGIAINSQPGEVDVEIGPAPTFLLALLDGGVLDTEELRGKVVMVDFWSSWCPPCIEEAPVLAVTYPLYADRGVEFVGVAIWDKEADVNKYVERFNATYLNGIDAQGRIAISYGVRGIPEKFFLDREGRLVRKYVGPFTAAKLESVLEEMLALE